MMEILLEKLPEAEILRYLGCPLDAEEVRGLVRDCAALLLKTAKPRAVWREFPIRALPNGVDIGGALFLSGRDIARVLDGCASAVLLCATLSADVDALLRREQVADMARSVVLDSCASAAIEEVCAQIDARIAAQYPQKYRTARYSPGYGDVPLSVQADFLALLDAPRKIGLCATDNSILTPRKSVTAVVGLSDVPVARPKKSCDTCFLREKCAFRKKEEHCGLLQTD